MVVKSVVRLDDSRFPNGDVFNVRATVALQNGYVGKLGAVEAANRDIRALVAPISTDKIVLVANPAMIYDNGRLGSGLENQYEMEANEAVRAYGLRETYELGISREGITLIGAAAVAGNYVVVADGTHKLKEITAAAYAALATKPAFAGKIIREDAVGGALAVNVSQTPTTYVVFEVVSN